MDPKRHTAYEDIFDHCPTPAPPVTTTAPRPRPPAPLYHSHPHAYARQYAPQYGGYPGGPAAQSIQAPGLCPSYQPGIPVPVPDRPTDAQGLMPVQELSL
ncbi:hypothetical protein B0H13DRAFT_2392390 [Mycena leptocephala]|nr:hypothetical protein B0H13DRAFT_2392390 [Mycena leptocephala]